MNQQSGQNPAGDGLGFSIVATVRNEAATIRSFVDSLLAQERTPDEIIIVDGNSTDGTTEILREYAGEGSIRLISRECNIAQGRNLGIGQAHGAYIAVTDAGCAVDPRWLLHIAECFASDERPDVVAGNFRFECSTEFEQAVVYATFPIERDNTPAARYYPSSRSVAFRKDAWEACGGYPEWLYAAEDTLFNIRLRHLGFRFCFCRDAIVRWRPRETWKALARQRINFARGNARVGIGTSGYVTNIQYHLAILLPLALMPLWAPAGLLSLGAALLHVRRHLWSQANQAASRSARKSMLWRVLLVMEFVRLVNIWGFLLGRWDRLTDRSFIRNQFAWMGVRSVDELPEEPR
ncbi:MAG: glycosyltransferase [Pseudomonadota bacterium]